MDKYIGKQLGQYHVLSLLGSGGFADVYLGEHVYLGSQAAIKMLTPRLTEHERNNFLAEARLLAKLSHPHIIRILDYGMDEEGTPYFVMEYAPTGSLRTRYPLESIVPSTMVISYVQQVASALQYAHHQKMVHRDIKPENMLLGKQHELLISDFGIAFQSAGSFSRTLQEVAGTAFYMAPEQFKGKPQPASDQYALGIVVYEWLCGVRPFRGDFLTVAQQQLFATPPSLVEKNPSLTPAVEQVVMIALAKDPKQRFANVLTFAKALEQALLPLLPPQTKTNADIGKQSYSFVVSPILPVQEKPTNAVTPLPDAVIQPVTPLPESETERKKLVSRRAFLIGGVTLGAAGALGIAALSWFKMLPPPGEEFHPVSSNGTMFGMNPQRTRFVPGEKLLNPSNVKNLKLRWSVYLGGAISLTSPIIVENVIYIGSTNSHLYAVRADNGTILWSFATDNQIFSTPAVADGLIYFGSDDKHVYAITRQGQLHWKFPVHAGVPGSPVVVDKVVYIGSQDGSCYALDATTGRQLWARQTGAGIVSSPAVIDNKVYFGSFDSYFYALDATTGNVHWKTSLHGGIFSSPAVVNGMIYVGGHDTNIYALKASTGDVSWKVKTNDVINSSPAVWNDTIYIGSKDANLYALDLNGHVLWRRPVLSEIASSPTIANDVIYVGSWDHNIYALDVNTGKILWQYQTNDGIESSPAVVNGVLYIGSRDGSLYAFALSNT